MGRPGAHFSALERSQGAIEKKKALAMEPRRKESGFGIPMPRQIRYADPAAPRQDEVAEEVESVIDQVEALVRDSEAGCRTCVGVIGPGGAELRQEASLDGRCICSPAAGARVLVFEADGPAEYLSCRHVDPETGAMADGFVAARDFEKFTY